MALSRSLKILRVSRLVVVPSSSCTSRMSRLTISTSLRSRRLSRNTSEVKRIGYDNASDIAENILDRFEAGEFDVATLFYNRFESVISQVPTARQVIPAVIEEDAAGASSLYDYEPGEEAILAELLPRAVATQVFAALLENAASEQGARMTAMDNATRNAGEMIDRLTTVYNRSRQAAITKELIEIISGAEAL